jgi:isopentenyl phosphate kinase
MADVTPLVLVKVGGSALTDKAGVEVLRTYELRETARQVASAVGNGIRLIVVHGAGSFGHTQARRFGVKAGFFCEQSVGGGAALVGEGVVAVAQGGADGAQQEAGRSENPAFGFADTRRSVTRLNHYVVEALINEGVAAVGVSPFPTWKTDKGILVSDKAEEVAELLRLGFVPVLHGDAVLDQTSGCTILSGDKVMERLADLLQPSIVGFITDVPGVYDRPPRKDSHGTQGADGGGGGETQPQLISELLVTPTGKIKAVSSSSASASKSQSADDIQMEVNEKQDVTGGMRTKVECAANIVAKCRVPVYIAQVCVCAYRYILFFLAPGASNLHVRVVHLLLF